MVDLLAQESTLGREMPGGLLVVLAIIYVAFFACLTIAAWAKARKGEREAYYQHEVEKRIIEAGGATTDQLRDLRTDEARRRWVLRRERLKLSGLVTAAGGIGLFFALQFVLKEGVRNLSWVPVAIGVAILSYVYLMSPKSADD